jgi:hypothetical protein
MLLNSLHWVTLSSFVNMPIVKYVLVCLYTHLCCSADVLHVPVPLKMSLHPSVFFLSTILAFTIYFFRLTVNLTF